MGNSPIIIFEVITMMGNEHMHFFRGNIYISCKIMIKKKSFSQKMQDVTPKQVIYHFDNNLDIIHTNIIGNSWEIFNFFLQKHIGYS
jgi:hypothetical protein